MSALRPWFWRDTPWVIVHDYTKLIVRPLYNASHSLTVDRQFRLYKYITDHRIGLLEYGNHTWLNIQVSATERSYIILDTDEHNCFIQNMPLSTITCSTLTKTYHYATTILKHGGIRLIDICLRLYWHRYYEQNTAITKGKQRIA